MRKELLLQCPSFGRRPTDAKTGRGLIDGWRSYTTRRVNSGGRKPRRLSACSSYQKGEDGFHGFIPIDEEGVPYCLIPSYASDPIRDKKLELAEQEIKSLKKDNHILKEDSNSFNEMFAILASTNPAIAKMMRKKKEAATTRGERTSGTSNDFVSGLFDMNSH
ncbi:unnamed protein product [Arabis nemorensis]|uniref:Uncharacterized protein n=1 Tax=Arabis nemorensis TaxID=586526 RepID=A0A565C0W1_9BRAS|nr:unnamed protein product [Arabis nemorensis]